jgi:hypothetical protein
MRKALKLHFTRSGNARTPSRHQKSLIFDGPPSSFIDEVPHELYHGFGKPSQHQKSLIFDAPPSSFIDEVPHELYHGLG